MYTLDSLSNFVRYFILNIIYFIILFTNNKFVDNFLKKIGLSYIEQNQIYLYQLSGIAVASIILVFINNIIKIKDILLINLILYFFSTLAIILIDNHEVGILIYYALQSFGYTIVGLIILSLYISPSKINQNYKIFLITLSCATIYFIVDYYFQTIINHINFSFYNLIIGEIIITICLFLLSYANVFLGKKDKKNIIRLDELQNFSLILKFSQIEFLTSYISFLLLYIILNAYYEYVNINILIEIFNNHNYKFISIFLFVFICIIIINIKFNILELTPIILILIFPLVFNVINNTNNNISSILSWVTLILLFYNLIASNLIHLTKKYNEENCVLAILLYFASCIIGLYNGHIIAISNNYNQYKQISEFSIYFVLIALIVYHLALLNRYRINK